MLAMLNIQNEILIKDKSLWIQVMLLIVDDLQICWKPYSKYNKAITSLKKKTSNSKGL